MAKKDASSARYSHRLIVKQRYDTAARSRVATEAVFAGLRRPAETSPVAYELRCACGASLRGTRQAQAQTVSSTVCGAKRFVLPRSILPDVVAGSDRPVAAPARKTWPRAAVAGGMLLAFAGVVAWLVFHLNGKPAAVPPLSNEELFEQHLATSRADLADGAYRQAARELATALQIADSLAGRLSIAERRRLQQQQREAAILGDLLSESLAEIARQAAGIPDREWQEIFQQRYAGQSFILDDTVHRDAAGRFHLNLKLVLANSAMKLDLGQVKILQSVPQLSRPQRVLVGLRLAGLRNEPAGWSVILDPDGGVLMTDPDMASSLSVPIDAELREVLNRQKVWLEFLP